jgi:hypothetical protein
MVNHELVLKPGDTLTLTVADHNDRSTTRNNNANSQAGNWNGGAKKNRTRKVGGKRELSGYMKFCKAMRPEILKENPGIEFKDVGKRLGEKWRAMSDSEQKKY